METSGLFYEKYCSSFIVLQKLPIAISQGLGALDLGGPYHVPNPMCTRPICIQNTCNTCKGLVMVFIFTVSQLADNEQDITVFVSYFPVI